MKRLILLLAAAMVATSCTTWTWGLNADGQLGDGTTTSRSSPVSLGTDYIDASAAGSHTCHITDGRALLCWGDNTQGQLGDGTTTDRSSPTAVGAATDWTGVDAGGVASLLNTSYTCAIKVTGTLWCWGDNFVGQLGLGDTTDRLTPTQVGSETDWRKIATGGGTSCGIRTSAGELWCWGAAAPDLATGATSPVRITTDTGWSQVSLGSEHGCAIRAGELHCWGANEDGQIGNGTTASDHDLERIGTDTDWRNLGLGASHSCATRTDATLWCWGSNATGNLGDGTTTERHTPTRIGTGTDWIMVAGGGIRWPAPFNIEVGHTCGTRLGGTLWCWGNNADGQLGDGTTTDRLTPTEIGSGGVWINIDLGESHTVALENS